MKLTGNYNGHEVNVLAYDGITFESPSLGNTRFNSADALQKALDKLDAEASKDFTNRTAYMMPGWGDKDGAAIEVNITSHRGDDAWIVSKDGKRSKVSKFALFESAADVHAYITLKRECDARVKAANDAIPRWKPQK